MAGFFCTCLRSFRGAKAAERGSVLAGAQRLLGMKGGCFRRYSLGWTNCMTEYPSFDLAGQVALVTGAARGLGRAISLALAHAGADVALGLRAVNAHSGLPHEIEARGRRALPWQMDMTRLDQIFQAVDNTAAHFGRLDILVNNAGIAP